MKTKIKISLSLLMILIICIAGCSGSGWFSGSPRPQQDPQITQSSSMEKRFDQTPSKNPTVVESALDLSKKYAILSEQASAMKQENQQLLAENRSLRERNLSLEADLKKTTKELNEANGILTDMRVELNNWKNNILGFRNEIRQADSEQLKALLEIIKILGGEIKTDPNQTTGANQKEFVHQADSPQAKQNKGTEK
jgi:chromosome segregation ATPase